jgi:hypothetical protein
MITKVKLKVEQPTTETLNVSDGGELKYAVTLGMGLVVGLFAHRDYAEVYVKAFKKTHPHTDFSIREVAE